MPEPDKTFKLLVRTITIWAPKTYTDAMAEHLIQEVEPFLDIQLNVLATVLDDAHPEITIEVE